MPLAQANVPALVLLDVVARLCDHVRRETCAELWRCILDALGDATEAYRAKLTKGCGHYLRLVVEVGTLVISQAVPISVPIL